MEFFFHSPHGFIQRRILFSLFQIGVVGLLCSPVEEEVETWKASGRGKGRGPRSWHVVLLNTVEGILNIDL
jgi:hypothetical protein